MDNDNEIIKNAFIDSGIRSPRALKFYLKRNHNKDYTIKKIKDVLNTINTVEIFKNKERNDFKIVGNIGSYQIDIMFFDDLKRYNSGYNSLLVAIHIPNRK